jgi:hypothetical protein
VRINSIVHRATASQTSLGVYPFLREPPGPHAYPDASPLPSLIYSLFPSKPRLFCPVICSGLGR